MSATAKTAREVFVAAVKLAPEEWDAYLKAHCGADDELRRRVRNLLSAHEEAGSFLHSPAAPATNVTLGDPLGERPGAVIGPYKLLEQIGEGGFGVVFRAEQTEPIRRKVALKVIKPGMDTRQVIARFEAERQALALMDHPNIAKVLEAGATDSGRPYFVMELIQGVPATEYCDQNRRTPKERLELFVGVCRGVQHAHQKGIIHRDIKPSNVLVTLHDGTPVVKIIDFGIAKATGQQLTDKTLFTKFTQMIGTPLYMSPEQADKSALDIDTRSDIYSLGVLLYELLTGTTPFEKERLKEASYDEIRRIIREEEPPKPSTRISSLGETSATASANRRCDPKRLSQLCRGELDWIVMKALEKDRNRRYETVGAFAADVERYLADEPVQARPPSGWYRFRKFARRNRAALWIVSVLVIAALVALGSIGWVMHDRGERALAEVERGSRLERKIEVALHEAAALEKQAQGARAHPAQWRASLTSARSTTQRAEAFRDSAPDLVSAELHRRLAELRAALDAEEYDRHMVARLDEIMLRQADVSAGGQRYAYADILPEYGQAFRDYGIQLGVTDAREAAKIIRDRPPFIRDRLVAALDDWLVLASYVASRPRTDAQQAELLWGTNVVRSADPDPWRLQIRQARGERDLPKLEELARSEEAQRQPAQTLIQLARTFGSLGAPEPAAQLLTEALPRFPDHFWVNTELASAFSQMKPPVHDKAARYFAVATALRPDSTAAQHNLATCLKGQNDLPGAIAAFKKAIELEPRNVHSLFDLGNTLAAHKDVAGAVAAYKQAIAVAPTDFKSYLNLGELLRAQKDWTGAFEVYSKVIELDATHASAHNNLGIVLLAQKDVPGASAAFQKAIDLDPKNYHAHGNLGVILWQQKDLPAAISVWSKAAQLEPTNVTAHRRLGTVLSEAKDWPAAVAAYRKVVELTPEDANAYHNLGVALHARGDLPAALAAYKTSIDLNPRDARAHFSLGLTLRAQGDLPGAIAAYKKCVELDPKHPSGHGNLGNALMVQDDVSGAMVAFRKAVEVHTTDGVAYHNLGNALAVQNDRAGALAALQKAIQYQPQLAEAHCKLGEVLGAQGRFVEGLSAMKRGHDLRTRSRNWPYPSAQWVKNFERLVELDGKLPSILKGELQPTDAAERAEYATVCLYKQLFAASARFYEQAFASQPELADNPKTTHRYDAARAAARAGCGHGKDDLDEASKTSLRRQALAWLRAELDAKMKSVNQKPMSLPGVQKSLKSWQRDADLTGVRDPANLSRLPKDEQLAWRQFWADVDAFVRK